MENIKKYIVEKLIINKNIKTQEKSDPDDPMTWKVGDILAGTYGYSMTLPHFYKIIKRTAKMFTVKRMKGKIVSGHKNGQWQEIADENAPLDNHEYRAKINKWGRVRVDDISVRLWDGEPLYGDDMD